MDEAGVEALKDAIRHMHGLEATWVESVPVREMHEGAIVWDGEVQVFEVKHPKTSRAYAWSHATEGAKRKFFAVLGVAPITDPVMAVRAVVMAEAAARA